MTLMRYQPWGGLSHLHNEIDRLIRGGNVTRYDEDEQVAAWVPAVDVREEDDRFVIHADVPGVDPKDIEVTLENGVLTVSGHRESEKKEEGKGFSRVERSSGSFFRRFTLPDTADAEKIKAKSNNGVLEIAIAKHDKLQPRRIKIDA